MAHCREGSPARSYTVVPIGPRRSRPLDVQERLYLSVRRSPINELHNTALTRSAGHDRVSSVERIVDRPTVLVVDDDHEFVEAASLLANARQFEASSAHTLSGARLALGSRPYDLVLMDVGLPDGSGLELLDEIRSSGSAVAVVTGSDVGEMAARDANVLVGDYVLKPLSGSRLDEILSKAYRTWHLRSHQVAPAPNGFIGTSRAMQSVYEQIQKVGPTDVSVLLIGESGTGKEIAAQALHANSNRSGPFVAVNCGAVAPELLASHLFGHERGSFTGAVRQHKGHFEQADGGTVFLDEITEMPMALQAHLLRVLETRRITRVGGSGEQAVDVRVVAATNRDPMKAIDVGQLRADLFFRLGEFCLALPPLRERDNDAVLIAESIVQQLNARYGTNKRLDPTASACVRNYSWPGNVRELRNLVHRGHLLSSDDVVRIACAKNRALSGNDPTLVSFRVGTSLGEVEREMMLRTLAHFRGDKVKAAQALGVSAKTIYNHLARQQTAVDGALRSSDG